MGDLGAAVVLGVQVFAVACLAGMALWKIRPASSPLWATLAVCGVAVALLGGGAAAGVCLGGFAGFAYLEWRSIHRPAVVRWPTGVAWAGGAALILLVVAIYATHHVAERDAPLPPGMIGDGQPRR